MCFGADGFSIAFIIAEAALSSLIVNSLLKDDVAMPQHQTYDSTYDIYNIFFYYH